MIMNQFSAEKKSKRNFSGIETHYSNSLPLYPIQPKGKKNPIKINKNKLPSDFFMRSQSDRPDSGERNRHSTYNRFRQEESSAYQIRTNRKAQSEKMHISPEKTSFFGFFQNHDNESKSAILHKNGIHSLGKSKNLVQNKLTTSKRKFSTRDEPKRENIINQNEINRNYTPVTHSQRSDLLDLFPATYDKNMGDLIVSTNRHRNLGGKIRKEHATRKKDIGNQNLGEFYNPEQQPMLTYRKNHFEPEIVQIDPNCITFFNAKPTSIAFPPVSSKSINRV